MSHRSIAYEVYCGEINLTVGMFQVISIYFLNVRNSRNRFIDEALNEFTVSRNDKWAQRTVCSETTYLQNLDKLHMTLIYRKTFFHSVY
jgi:hypothetical protein